MIYINITNSFNTRKWTGIQRVVREVSRHLRALREDVALVIFNSSGMHVLNSIESINDYFKGVQSEATCSLSIEEINPGDFMLDMDSTWGDYIDYAPIISKLKKRGLVYVKLHHDAVPLLFPQYCDKNTILNFTNDFYTGLRYADHWICTTQIVRADLQRIFQKMNYGEPPTSIVPLGSDIDCGGVDEGEGGRFDFLRDRKVVLAVGTIEPRKNYDLVLDSFELYQQQPHADGTACLVMVGKSGWNNEKIRQRIAAHPRLNKDIFWISDATDSDLNNLYGNAWACLCLSHYEGFGLPAVEALSRHVPVICIEGSAMQEVTKGLGYPVEKNADAVAEALHTYLSPKEPSHINNYEATTWAQTAEGVNAVFEKLAFRDIGFEDEPTQVVYISIRPEKIKRSLESVALRMKFIDEAVVLTSDSAYAEMGEALQSVNIRTTLLKESEIGLANLPDDHVERNMLLRKMLYSQEQIRSNFIAFDDDYVAIAEIGLDIFMENGKHKAYYFWENGFEWQGAFPKPTSFDKGVWRTVAYLDESGYDVKLYSSHQPQIINKGLAKYIYDKTSGLGLDEWSSYFNIAKHLKYDGFLSHEYITAGWSGDHNSWVGDLVPSRCLFYNDPSLDGSIESFELQAYNWVNSAETALSLKKKQKKNVLAISIHSNQIVSDSNSMICTEIDRIKIPIRVYSVLYSLEWEFLGRKFTFDFEKLPSFIFIPAGDLRENGVRKFNLKVSAKNLHCQNMTANLDINL